MARPIKMRGLIRDEMMVEGRLRRKHTQHHQFVRPRLQMSPPHLTIHHPLEHLTEYRINAPDDRLSQVFLLLFLVGSVVGSVAWSSMVRSIHPYDLLAFDRQEIILSMGLLLSLSAVFILICVILTHRSLLSESIMPIPSLGILLTSRSRSLLAPTPIENERLFIPMEDVEHIVINEALFRFSVIGFLEILRRKGREHIVVFPTLLPPTKSIIPIYQDLQIIISSKS